MFQSILVFALVFFAQIAEPSIIFPLSGDTLRGQVKIIGNLNVPNFSSAELAFSYVDSADRWFTIQTFPQPPVDSTIATWDTTSLTDGDYTLHLRVFFQDGTSQDIAVSDLKIRNDVPIPTEILSTITATESLDSITINPLPVSSPAGPTSQPEPTRSTYPSPTPLPANPAAVTSSSIYTNFVRGALVVFVLFLFFSLLLRLRKN